jgi:hypothetical protein
MHRKITRRARAGKCGFLGARGFSFSAAQVERPAKAR